MRFNKFTYRNIVTDGVGLSGVVDNDQPAGRSFDVSMTASPLAGGYARQLSPTEEAVQSMFKKQVAIQERARNATQAPSVAAHTADILPDDEGVKQVASVTRIIVSQTRVVQAFDRPSLLIEPTPATDADRAGEHLRCFAGMTADLSKSSEPGQDSVAEVV